MAIAAQQPNPAPAHPPQPAEDQGVLFDREVALLRDECLVEHNDKGRVLGAILGLAAIVASVWAAMVTSSFLLGLAIYLIGGSAMSSIYHGLRKSDFMDARKALATPSFKQFIQNNKLDLSIDSIVNVHNQYKKHVIAQSQNIPEPVRA